MRKLMGLAIAACAASAAVAQTPPAAQTWKSAQSAPAALPAAAPTSANADTTTRGGEPAVSRTVIDDGRARIEELRVRGQLQKVTVDPKGRAPSYEIITGDGSRDLGEGANTSRGAAGKRVWKVLNF